MNIEFQHSRICSQDVLDRKHDYELTVQSTVWIIDGSDVVVHRTSKGITQLEYPAGWKHHSFTAYDYVLLDVLGDVYRVAPRDVICNIACATTCRSTAEVVQCLLSPNPSLVWSLWSDDVSIQPTLRISQQGAGNGKTFGIWREIATSEDFDVELIVTKQHTAKDVIYAELIAQCERNEPHIINSGLYGDEEADCRPDERCGRQYVVEYEHTQTHRQCAVVIGTVDSFVYSLTESRVDAVEYFGGLLQTLCSDGPSKMNPESGKVRYGGRAVALNRRARLWVDEVQDLPTAYLDAICRLMRDSGIEVVLVGDRLQSLGDADNCMTKAARTDGEDVCVVVEAPFNVNRRIRVRGMAAVINRLVRFRGWELPEISLANEATLDDGEAVSVDVVDVPWSMFKHEKAGEYVDVVLEKVAREVDRHGYKPKDFMFLFPIMKMNIIAVELESRLCEFWNHRLGARDAVKHAVLHRHEEGQSIDTTKSVDASRIMSIRAAKGDGRAVVFALELTNRALQKVGGGGMGLAYESHFHVALTRAIRKTYVVLSMDKDDDITRRFKDAGYEIVFPLIHDTIRIFPIIERMELGTVISLMKRKGVEDFAPEENFDPQTEPIEWGIHCVKRAVYVQCALSEIVSRVAGTVDEQVSFVLKKLSKLSVCSSKGVKDFYDTLRTFKEKKEKEKNGGKYQLPHFPVCAMEAREGCLKIIRASMERNNKRLQSDTKTALCIDEEAQVYDAVVMRYQIDLVTNLTFRQMSEMELYDITNFFHGGSSLCKERLLLEEVHHVRDLIRQYLDDVLTRPDIRWNIEHRTSYDGQTPDFKVHFHSSVIGNTQDSVFHLKFVSERSQLNHWKILAEVALERFILKNAKGNFKETNNKTRFTEKTIHSYVFDLRNRQCEHIHWTWDDPAEEFSLELAKSLRDASLAKYSADAGQIHEWMQQEIKKVESGSNPLFRIMRGLQKKKTPPPAFVLGYFAMLYSMSKTRKEFVKELLENRGLFESDYAMHLKNRLDTYFDIASEETW
jgi:hypothetical protein